MNVLNTMLAITIGFCCISRLWGSTFTKGSVGVVVSAGWNGVCRGLIFAAMLGLVFFSGYERGFQVGVAVPHEISFENPVTPGDIVTVTTTCRKPKNPSTSTVNWIATEAPCVQFPAHIYDDRHHEIILPCLSPPTIKP